ncbi:tetratricopeptide repeat protein, partial [bacterium]|nr:tetratricopeptide repeat protein [bacterium]
PKKEEAWYNMGTAFGDLKQYEKAVECYDKAVKINPKKEEAWYNMGNAFVEIEEYANAWSAYLQFFKYVSEFPPFTYKLIYKLKIIASFLFSEHKALQKLKQKKNTLDDQFDGLIQLILLGKLSDVTETVETLLNRYSNYPDIGLKIVLFLLEADLIERMNKKEKSEEASVIMKYLILFRLKLTSKEHIKDWFIRFIYNYLSISDKESFNLKLIQNLIDSLRQQGIPISNTILTIIHALQHPESRKAQAWMVDPLFAEIIRKLK